MKDAFERRIVVPMQFLGRISIDESDPGYVNYIALTMDGYKIAVLLNGTEQKECTTADPNEGTVCRLRTVKGLPFVHAGVIQTETVKGVVTIRITR